MAHAFKSTDAVSENAQIHADRVLSAAKQLEREIKRLKEHAAAIRANVKAGRVYSDAEIENFRSWREHDIRYAADRAVLDLIA
jgi:hypothetical protein